MTRHFALVAFIGFVACSSTPAPSPETAETEPAAAEAKTERQAPLFENMGNLHHKVSTDSELAQRYFDQGLSLAYAFNHAEAERSFREAARIDPECAMCWWGAAIVLGPHVNAAMFDEAVPRAWEALHKAKAASIESSKKERAYIRALEKRYVREPVKDRHHLDVAYAKAMREVAKQYPDDLDAQTLFAEALMDTMPWNYWKTPDEAKPEAKEFIAILEKVMKRKPDHFGALHLYIHAVEASSNPGRAEVAADRLAPLVPAAGHLVHMPAHIYLRVGRYEDASEANVKAAKADESYISQCRVQGFYPAMYYPHNIHFLWFSSALEGRSDVSIDAAEKLSTKIQPEMVKQFPEIEQFLPVPLYAYARFGKWEKILEAPKPPDEFVYNTAMWHYARGLAFASTGKPEEAGKEAAEVDRLYATEAIDKIQLPTFPGKTVLGVARVVVAGEAARAKGDLDTAIAKFEKAVKLEDAIPYMEPPYWYFSVRQYLGAALLEAKRPKEAEKVYRRDLQKNPKNGWSYYGLAQSLEAQGKKREAEAARKDFGKAWAKADVEIAASRF